MYAIEVKQLLRIWIALLKVKVSQRYTVRPVSKKKKTKGKKGKALIVIPRQSLEKLSVCVCVYAHTNTHLHLFNTYI